MHAKIKSDKKFAQKALRMAGYGNLVIDGVHGLKTLAAIELWDKDEARGIETYGRLDARSEDNLLTLFPECQISVRKWWKAKVEPWMSKTGKTVKIIQGTRSDAEQNALYAKGRTAPGPKVTNAKAGSSYHSYLTAYDIGIFNGSKYEESDKWYIQFVRDCGTPEGFINGGSWKSITDWPHFQYQRYGATVAELRQRFNK